MVEITHDIPLGIWIDEADDIYAESKILMYKKLASRRPFTVPAFMIHWSIELYLKGFLMNHGKLLKGHDLNRLFKLCIQIDPNINNSSLRTQELPYDQSYWIDQINPYGKNEGGIRYLNSKITSYFFSDHVYDFLDDLVKYIKRNIDPNKDITHFL
jgi:hypothetical protein